MPLISVVIPVFNGEKTIKKTIESVLRQTFSDFELLLINDGSQDSTLDIVSQIPERRIKIFSYPNAGLAASRNRGIQQAIGEYISFIDADDLWTADKLASQLKALQSNPKAAVAYSWTDYIDEKDRFLRSGFHATLNGNVYKQLLARNFLENGSNPLIYRGAFAEVGYFDESLKCVEDWDIYLRLAAKYDFVCVPSPQILYRLSTDSMSTDIKIMETTGLHVINKAFSQTPESLKNLRKDTVSDFYMYLALKSLEGIPRFQKSLTALKYLWRLIRNHLGSVRRRRYLTSILLFKIVVGLILPPRQAETVLKFFKKKD